LLSSVSRYITAKQEEKDDTKKTDLRVAAIYETFQALGFATRPMTLDDQEWILNDFPSESLGDLCCRLLVKSADVARFLALQKAFPECQQASSFSFLDVGMVKLDSKITALSPKSTVKYLRLKGGKVDQTSKIIKESPCLVALDLLSWSE
jgi:hypothetical protein